MSSSEVPRLNPIYVPGQIYTLCLESANARTEIPLFKLDSDTAQYYKFAVLQTTEVDNDAKKRALCVPLKLTGGIIRINKQTGRAFGYNQQEYIQTISGAISNPQDVVFHR